MPFIDQIKVGSTTRDIQDTGARANEGTLANLTTTEKGNLVGAINEVNAAASDLKSQIQQKANIDGYYESMTVGNAEQLVATVGVEDSVPYNFRTAGGSADIGDRLTEKIIGGTIAWNQQFNVRTYTDTNNGITYASNTDGVWHISGTATDIAFSTLLTRPAVKADHVILMQWGKPAVPNEYRIGNFNSGNLVMSASDYVIYKGARASMAFGVQVYSGVTVDLAIKPQYFDLTQMFGSTIADYIYSLETATAGAGVAWFRHLFPKDYYEYNAGELMSVQAASHKTVGFNALDADAAFANADGITKSENEYIGIASKFAALTNASWEKMAYVPGMSYYGMAKFSVHANVTWMRVEWIYTDGTKTNGNHVLAGTTGISYALSNASKTIDRFVLTYGSNGNNECGVSDICINLSWDGERDGEYEPYVEHVYPLDDSLILRGIPKLDSANNLYYDGDTYESDGTVTRRYGVITIDGVNTKISGIFEATQYGMAVYLSSADSTWNWVRGKWGRINAFSNRFIPSMASYSNMPAMSFIGSSGTDTTMTFILPSSVTSKDEADAWFAENPTTIIYELTTLTTETAETFQNPQIVDDFGTEEYVDAGVTASTPTRDVAIPVGHETTYRANLRAKLEMAPDSPSDGDGDYIVRQTNGTNEYAKLVIPTELPTNPTTDGTYHLKATVSNGTTTLTWEADT